MSVTDGVLSIHARNLSDSATLRGLPDSQDPTYQDCWPSARYPSDGPDDHTPESAWAGYVERFHASQVGATDKESLIVDQCECCRAAPGMPHAVGCEVFEERLTYHPDGVRFGRETPRDLPVCAPNEHPTWVCRDCGQDRYGVPNAISTWHMGKCDICEKEKYCTEPRDFGAKGTSP